MPIIVVDNVEFLLIFSPILEVPHDIPECNPIF